MRKIRFFGVSKTAPNEKGEPTITLKPLLRTPIFDIFLRKIELPNPDFIPLHNHGVEIYTITLLGGYKDRWDDGSLKEHRIGSVNKLPLHSYHTLTNLYRKPTWTIGIHCKWRGTMVPGFLVEGEHIPLVEYAMRVNNDNIVKQVRDVYKFETE